MPARRATSANWKQEGRVAALSQCLGALRHRNCIIRGASIRHASRMSVPSDFNFFSAKQFAVVGANNDRAKYGNKVLRWYQDRQLPVKPVHPKEAQVESLDAIKSLEELSDPSHTAVSIITPPKASLEVIKTAQKLGVPALWLQPGAEDQAVAEYIRENKVNAVLGGPCILVIGDSLRREGSGQRQSSL